MKRTDGNPAIILLGHGSRVPDAGRHMERIARGLKARYGHEVVEVCHLSRLGPHLPDAFRRCVERGAKQVVVIPYFLHDGLHLVLDIPEVMQELAGEHPDVRLVLGRNLGFDDLLVDLVEKRIAESRGERDVRELALPPRGQYPVPPGQCEFVAMTPEEAERYRSQHGDHHHS
jgi:sirohydrochlorin ferrochelatase